MGRGEGRNRDRPHMQVFRACVFKDVASDLQFETHRLHIVYGREGLQLSACFLYALLNVGRQVVCSRPQAQVERVQGKHLRAQITIGVWNVFY